MNDEDDITDFPITPYQYYEQQIISKIHHFYISETIVEPNQYIDMIHHIRSGSPTDIVHIHLNTPGGNLDTGVQLINAIQTSESHVICSLEAKAHSLGSLIFLAADEFVVHDNSMMMFHNFSGTTGGKGHEQMAEITATIEWFNTISEQLCVPFLSDDEFNRLIKGEDLYFHSNEIRVRLEKMVKILEAKEKKLTKKQTNKK